MGVVTVTCTILDSFGNPVPKANVAFQLMRSSTAPEGVLLSTYVAVTADSNGVAVAELYPYSYCNSPYDVYVSSPDGQYSTQGTAQVLNTNCTLDEIFQPAGELPKSFLETAITSCQGALTSVLSNAGTISESAAGVTASALSAENAATAAEASQIASNLSAVEAAANATTATTMAGVATSEAGNAFTWGTAAQEAEAAVGSNAAAAAGSAAAALASAQSISAAALAATSTSSLIIGLGSTTLAIQAGKLFVPGQWLIIVQQSNPANFMAGQVTSYSGTSLAMNILAVGGSGTFSSWSVSLSGASSGSSGSAGANLYLARNYAGLIY